MKKILITIITLALLTNTWAQTIQPAQQTIGNLNISVDPRIELLSTIQILSNYQVINRESDYSKEIQAYFNKFSTLDAVTFTDQLTNFAYDAPAGFILYFSQPPDLKQLLPYSDYLVKRAGGKENLDHYRKSIEQFAKKSDFEKFWNSKLDFYNNMLELTAEEAKDADPVKIIEDYFNEKRNSYNIIIAPLFNGHNYGTRLPAVNNKFDIYSCITPFRSKDGIPYISKESVISTVCHEFSHSFVNPETEKYADRIESFSQLLEPIKNEMARIAYSNWSICVNEHIIRAIGVRIEEIYKNQAKSQALMNQEKSKRFIYIEPLVEKLKEYEKQRDTKHITFSEFVPRLLDVFDSISKTDYSKLSEPGFLGPIKYVRNKQKAAWIYPTNDKDTASLKIAVDHVTEMYNRFEKDGGTLIPDTVALNMDLSDYGLMVYGTIESNLFLSKYKDSFPFKIKDNVIIADKEYNKKDTKLISCLPNPQNPRKGMSVYTALDNKYINDINNVYHGPQDYVVFLSRKNVLSEGYYYKTGDWKFIK